MCPRRALRAGFRVRPDDLPIPAVTAGQIARLDGIVGQPLTLLLCIDDGSWVLGYELLEHRRRPGNVIRLGIEIRGPAQRLFPDGQCLRRLRGDRLELLRRLRELAALGRPLVVGTSRKSFLGHLLGEAPPPERLPGTIATCVLAYERGATVLRVHDVAPVRAALAVAAATLGAR